MKKVLPKSIKSSTLLKKCHQIDSFLHAYSIPIMILKMKMNNQMQGNINLKDSSGTEKKGQGSNLATEISQVSILNAPLFEEENTHIALEDPFEIAYFLNWRWNEYYQELKEIENSLHMVEYNEMPPTNTNNLFSE